MTATEAKEIKRIIKNLVGNYKMVYSSKNEELRVRVVLYEKSGNVSKDKAEELKNNNIIKILNTLTRWGFRPPYRQEYKQDAYYASYFVVFS